MGEASRCRARHTVAFALGAVILFMALALLTGGAFAASNVHLSPGDPTACQGCHGTQASGSIAGAPTDNRLCYSCHLTGAQAPVFGRVAFEQGAHGSLWTAKSRTPLAHGDQAANRRGLCVNCHDPHNSSSGRAMTWDGSALDSTGLCVSCHSDTRAYGAFPGPRVYQDSPHGDRMTGVSRPKAGYATGECLNCHDPHGQGYAKLLTGPRGSDFCLAAGCHDTARPGSLWAGRMAYQAAAGVHGAPPAAPKQGVRRTYPGRDALPGSCANCHDPHGALDPRTGRPTPAMTNAAGSELCFQCHTSLRFVFGNISRHPVDQPGSDLTCQSCHNPHTVSRFQPVSDPDRPSQAMPAGDEFCLRCHDGSFGFAADIRAQLSAGTHQPGCLNCHDPHGSSKPDLLR